MIPIYPINEETVKLVVGRPVLAVLSDGSEHVGVLTRIHNDRLYLNEEPQAKSSSKELRKTTRTKSAAAPSMESQSPPAWDWLFVPEWGPDPVAREQSPARPPGDKAVLELKSISALFLLL